MIPGPTGLAKIAAAALALVAIYATLRPKHGRTRLKLPRTGNGLPRKIDGQSIRRNHQPLG
jgi:hypothetical protein